MSNTLTQGRVLFVACVAALGGILFGYDTAVISGTTRIVADQFSLTEMSKGWYVGCALPPLQAWALRPHPDTRCC